MLPRIPQSPSSRLLRVRSLGNVVNLTTPAGLVVAALGGARVSRRPGGLLLAEHYRLRFPVSGAFTVGNVILTGGRWEDLERRYPRLLRHEEAHTWQYLYCLGLPFYPAYLAGMVWSLIRTGDLGAGNFFERQAGLSDGGYPDIPYRSLLAGVRALLDEARALLGRS
jgi:hypothetical protein